MRWCTDRQQKLPSCPGCCVCFLRLQNQEDAAPWPLFCSDYLDFLFGKQKINFKRIGKNTEKSVNCAYFLNLLKNVWWVGMRLNFHFSESPVVGGRKT